MPMGGLKSQTTANEEGKWRVQMAPLATAPKPVEIAIRGANLVVFHDVLIGDVWVCSGQSNMGFGLGNAKNAADLVPCSRSFRPCATGPGSAMAATTLFAWAN